MKAFVAASATLGLVLASTEASAFEFGTPATEHPFRTAQNFALEFRFSPYYAAVDDQPALNGNKPFKAAFGNAPRLYFGVEFDWQFYRIPFIGTIGPGVGVGLVSMSRPGTTITGRASGDDYGLTIYPLYLNAVLRVDTMWRYGGFPIVPYAKIGPAVGVWRATNADATSVGADGSKGKGSTAGTNMAVGASFALNALDYGASVSMDNESGINNTYIFAELYWLNLNNFGAGKSEPLYVGTKSWTAGLAFEF
jgi:hypothetical protein